ncbi:MAG TPA: Mur ligase family protein, partial [Polyangiaceae bacterium]
MTISLPSIAEKIGVAPAPAFPSGATISGWSIDSRTVNPGDCFFALRGPLKDGHDYVPQAVEKGAALAIVERPVDAKILQLVVPDSLAALQQLAARTRQRWGGTVVGVTGSAGKTTTKDAIASLLNVQMRTGRTIGNYNNNYGVPLSILRLADDCKAAVIEMGMNHAGEIRELARIAKPQIGVVTNAGWAHAEYFDNGMEGVALAKRELIEELPADG